MKCRFKLSAVELDSREEEEVADRMSNVGKQFSIFLASLSRQVALAAESSD